MYVWPNRVHKYAVARAPVICTRQHYKKRRCIDATVVAPERHFVQNSHFVIAEFVKNLARLRVLLGLFCGCLVCGEIRQHAARDRWIEPEALERGDDSVPPEYRAEPGYSSVGIGTVLRLRSHHVEIGQRTVHPVVKLFVIGENFRFLSTRAFECTGCLLNDILVVRLNVAMRIVIHFAGNRPLIAGIPPWFQMDLKVTDRLA